MDGVLISMNKEMVRPELLLREEPLLPEAMRQLNVCDAFAAMLGGRNVAVCLIAKRKKFHEVVLLAAEPSQDEVMTELLLYALDYVRVQGGRFVEIGAPNTHIRRHAMVQALGFRVVGVWPDHYPPVSVRLDSGETVLCRDMLRYRIELPVKSIL